jgi:hypothetical protein
MTTIRNSSDSRVLGWGALTVAVLVLAAFLSAVRGPSASASLRHGQPGVTTSPALTSAPGNG